MNKITILLFHITIIFASSHFNNDISSNYDVEILRDSWGVPHIYGTTDEDVAFGFAFAHSEDDFKTFQDVVLQTRGQLASVYGVKMAPVDYMKRMLMD